MSLAALLLAASACTTGGATPSSTPAAPSVAPPSVTPPSVTPPSGASSSGGPSSPAPIRSAGLARRCGAPDRPSALHRIRSTDGVTLAAASIGGGPRGVLLLHQSDGNSCGWWSFAGPWLADRGYRVLMVDLRCFGESSCPGDVARVGERLADIRAAAAWLRRSGARTVAVAGVSMGGTLSLVAGADPGIAASAVVDVSGELTDTVVQAAPPVSARTAVTRLRAPLLYLTAEGDLGVDHAADTVLLARAPTGLVTRTVAAGVADHGWALLTEDGRTPSRWAMEVEAFLRR
jgi:dienelactone hydrolase